MKANRLAVVTWVCALLLGAAGAAGAGGTAHAAQPSAEIDAPRTEVVTTGGTTTVLPTFGAASYNAQYKSSPAETVSDLTKIAAAGADIIGLQEMGAVDKRDAVRARFLDCDTCQFDAFLSEEPEQNATPILYRSTAFLLKSTGTKKVSKTTYVGPSGAGPSTVKAKFVNYVKLRHRATGKVVYVLNNHAVASVQGSDGGRDLSHPKRLDLYRQHMSGLQNLITELSATGAAVLVTGDFNVNYRKDHIVRDTLFPYFRMREVSTAASWEALGMPELGTHRRSDGAGNRLIDYVFYRTNAGVAPESQRILDRCSSDHRPVLVQFTIGS